MTPKQQRFIDEYPTDLNATQAAIRAGYSRKTAEVQGCRLLRNVKVRAAIAVKQDETAERAELTQEYVLENLTEIVERCMQRAPVMVRKDRVMVQMVDAEGRDVWTFNANGATTAVQLLGKHLGMFKDDAAGDPSKMSDEELERAIEARRRGRLRIA